MYPSERPNKIIDQTQMETETWAVMFSLITLEV